jgi:hypothetical protein
MRRRRQGELARQAALDRSRLQSPAGHREHERGAGRRRAPHEHLPTRGTLAARWGRRVRDRRPAGSGRGRRQQGGREPPQDQHAGERPGQRRGDRGRRRQQRIGDPGGDRRAARRGRGRAALPSASGRPQADQRTGSRGHHQHREEQDRPVGRPRGVDGEPHDHRGHQGDDPVRDRRERRLPAGQDPGHEFGRGEGDATASSRRSGAASRVARGPVLSFKGSSPSSVAHGGPTPRRRRHDTSEPHDEQPATKLRTSSEKVSVPLTRDPVNPRGSRGTRLVSHRRREEHPRAPVVSYEFRSACGLVAPTG